MAQRIERLIDETDTVIFTVTADTGMSGVDIRTTGVWYSQAQLNQIISLIAGCSVWLREEGIE